MNVSPLAYLDSLRIGTVDFVSPGEIKVLLELDAPESVALNAGAPHPFPHVNGYVLTPVNGGYIVGQVEWITIERSPFPKRKGLQDFGLIDLPYPLRKLSLNPLGTLKSEIDYEGHMSLKFRRGVDLYPSVGQPVVLPTALQLRSIVESGEHRHVCIGASKLAADAHVCVDPDRIFGRHLAVLGNTGSGKSCSVAGLIRWSLESAQSERETANFSIERNGPHARFIILDPNGEYGSAFSDLGDHVDVKRFSVEPVDGVQQLHVPLWLWNTEEWCAFTLAAPKAQRPALIQALRIVRDGSMGVEESDISTTRRYLRTLTTITRFQQSTGSPWGNFPHPKNFLEKISKWGDELGKRQTVSEEQQQALDDITAFISQLRTARSGQYPQYDFAISEVESLAQLLSDAHHSFGGSDSDTLPLDPDTPRPFSGEELVRAIEASAEQLNVVEHVETMLMRVRTLLSDARMKTIINPAEPITLEAWLNEYIGSDTNGKASVSVIDLSLVPVEVIHVITAVVARITLEAHQRYRKLNEGKVLPTVLVMEEAHTFIKRYKDDAENQSSAAVCCQVFEKIAREGRKFGLGLVLSSQRPSELSPSVLSQCNTFLLHRISNDRDQELVHRLVPDNLRGLLRDLPSLPARQAVLLGWAVELPTLLEVRHLPDAHRPQSNDPDFWATWTRTEERTTNWRAIAEQWQRQAHAETRECADTISHERDIPFEDDPFGDGEDDPFGDGEDDPFGDGEDDPFGDGEDDPFGDGEDDPFGDGEDDPFSDGEDDPFGDGEDDLFGDGEDDPFSDDDIPF